MSELLATILNELIADDVDVESTALIKRTLQRLNHQGTAQGAGEILRRVIDAATTLLALGPWRKAGQWASARLLVRDLAQVARYLARGEAALDRRIREVVQASLVPGPAVVVAHSLGSVIAWEALHQCDAAVPLFVTIGSPIGMRSVVWPHLRPRPPATPPTVGRWLNFWDRDDIIVARPIVEDAIVANAAAVRPESYRIDSDGLWVHTATKYLAKPDVAGPVIEALTLAGGI